MSMESEGAAPTDAISARDARREAQALVGHDFEARVLEPSPPAVTDEWFADDPLAAGDVHTGLLTPLAGAGITWDEWLADHAEHTEFVRDRWLGAYTRLGSPPPYFGETRAALHRLALYVLSPARRRVNGKIGLRFSLAGFGTPFFGDDEQVRVAGTRLVRQQGGTARVEPVTTLRRAAELALGRAPDDTEAPPDAPALGNVDEEVALDPAAAAFLAAWYGFAFSVLEALRADAESTDGGRVQLWPEHFDASFECLADAQRRRATFGASPGDRDHPDPYLYVTPWYIDDAPDDGRWNATGFRGAVLALSELSELSELADAADQRAAALAFFRDRRAVLAG
ncbi:MAG: hypothetical protein JOZ99_03505 [Actinobacteria bacterium]|nr:hypothetical protein [Actinomycetota bacterium]